MTPSHAPGSYAGLTQRQADLLSFLRQEEVRGRTPSFQEMADHLDITSKSSVMRLIDALVERGCITRIPSRARSIQLVQRDIDLSAIPTEALTAELNRRIAAMSAIGVSQ